MAAINTRRQQVKAQIDALQKAGGKPGSNKAKLEMLRRDDDRLVEMLDYVELFSETGLVRRLSDAEKAADAERKSLAGLEKLATAFKKDANQGEARQNAEAQVNESAAKVAKHEAAIAKLRERLADVRHPVRRVEASVRYLRERHDEEAKVGAGLQRMISLLGDEVEARAEARLKAKQSERRQAKFKAMIAKQEVELEAVRAANPPPATVEQPAVVAVAAAATPAASTTPITPVPASPSSETSKPKAAVAEVPAGAVSRVRATCDCEATRAGDLSFKEGDEIFVLSKVTPNIWKGVINGRIGRFLSRTVTVVEEFAGAAGASDSAASGAPATTPIAATKQKLRVNIIEERDVSVDELALATLLAAVGGGGGATVWTTGGERGELLEIKSDAELVAAKDKPLFVRRK